MSLQRLPAESPTDHASFLDWALQPEPRPAPDPKLSAAYRWVERARGAAPPNAEPSTFLFQCAQLEAKKLLLRALQQPGNAPSLEPREVIALVQFLKDVPPPEPDAVDLSRLTPDELTQFEYLTKKVRGT